MFAVVLVMRHLCRPSEKVGSLETQNDGMMNAGMPAACVDRQVEWP
jgi:hypothetical protein